MAISLAGGAKQWISIACKKPITVSATKLREHCLAFLAHDVSACHVVHRGQNAIGAAEEENPSSKRKDQLLTIYQTSPVRHLQC